MPAEKQYDFIVTLRSAKLVIEAFEHLGLSGIASGERYNFGSAFFEKASHRLCIFFCLGQVRHFGIGIVGNADAYNVCLGTGIYAAGEYPNNGYDHWNEPAIQHIYICNTDMTNRFSRAVYKNARAMVSGKRDWGRCNYPQIYRAIVGVLRRSRHF